MARNIEFEPEAERDLDDAIDYQGATSEAARRLADRIDAAIGQLLAFPESGRPIDPARRALYVSGTSYSILYEFSGDALRILAFAHASRDPDYWDGRRG